MFSPQELEAKVLGNFKGQAKSGAVSYQKGGPSTQLRSTSFPYVAVVTSDENSDYLLETSKKMYELSAGDGFVEKSESIGDMIKYIANEPSVGLYYIQQHAQHAVPNVVGLSNSIIETSRETLLQVEDLEDSITMARSMKECGFSIADEMITEVKRSLTILSTHQPIKGLIQQSSSCFQIGGSSRSPSIWSRNSGSGQRNSERMGGYLSSVVQSAKQKAGNIKWPRMDLMELRKIKKEDLGTHIVESLSAPPRTASSSLPLSSRTVDDDMEGDAKVPNEGKLRSLQVSYIRSDSYDEFKAEREARLEAWLGGGGKVDER